MRHDAGSRPAPAEEPFILTAMLSLVAASLWMALRPGLFLGFFYAPELLAITHLVTVGFITAIAMGILVRLVPMVFGVSDFITVMHQGKVLVEGTPEQIRGNEEVREVYLGVDEE